MRWLTIIAFVLFLYVLTGCKETPKERSRSDIDIEAIVARAERDARRVHLPSDLEEAGTNVYRITKVYQDAVELGDTTTARRADEKLSSLMLPQATSAEYVGTVRKLWRRAPDGSQTKARLEVLKEKMERSST